MAGKPVKILDFYVSPSRPLIGAVRLCRRGNAGLEGWQPQSETRGLELAAEHETAKTPA
jgi:hypothetical protein